MINKTITHTRRGHCHGQAMMEYLVVCAALAFALFFPIQNADSPDKPRTTVEILLQGFRAAYEKFSFALSLPA